MTFEEFKAQYRKAEAKKDKNLVATCTCGQHQVNLSAPLSDGELQQMFEAIKGGADDGSHGVLTLTSVGY